MSSVAFFDLLVASNSDWKEHCDVCVVGAGAAGIYLAVRLASNGLNVILIEAGSLICSDVSSVEFDTKFSADLYPGASKGRYFGVGGSTSHWGGLLIPHSEHDLRKSNNSEYDTWQHIVNTISAKSDIILKNLGYPENGKFFEFPHEYLGEINNTLNETGLDIAASLFLPFCHKNMSFLFKGLGSVSQRIKVITNAVVNSWDIGSEGESAKVKGLSAISKNRNKIEVIADNFVIAAGAIESARILLELNKERQVLYPTSSVGCYLADHLSISIADVAPASFKKAVTLFSPYFLHGWMRSFRFMEINPPLNSPRAFAHFTFNNENPGFLLAKKVLTAMQSHQWPKTSFSEVYSAIGDGIALGYARYKKSILYIAPGTKINLQLDIEQVRIYENRITLSLEKDRYGRQIPDIHWHISDLDLENIRTTANRIIKQWTGAKSGLPELIISNEICNSAKPYDAYHPVGICRMGNDPEAVVDLNLKVLGISNLSLVSTGVLPSAGTANPTFTMLCLTERLSEQLSAKKR